jgi:hypothetical protein
MMVCVANPPPLNVASCADGRLALALMVMLVVLVVEMQRCAGRRRCRKRQMWRAERAARTRMAAAAECSSMSGPTHGQRLRLCEPRKVGVGDSCAGHNVRRLQVQRRRRAGVGHRRARQRTVADASVEGGREGRVPGNDALAGKLTQLSI